MVSARERFLTRVREIPAEKLVFLDETGINRSMARSHGWSPRGDPVIDYRPNSRGDNYTVIGAVNHERIVCHSTIHGGMNTESWTAFVRDTLAPRLEPGDVLVMDNLKIHHHEDALELIRGQGAEVLFLPPYSPDFNPIEPVWSHMKWRMKTFAERDASKLPAAVWRALLSITTNLLRNWFDHCLYAQVN